MSHLTLEVEDVILQFFRGLDNDDLKKIHCGRDVDDRLDEETIDEIKDRIWYLLKTQHIRWYYLAERIKEMVKESESENEEEDEAHTESDDGGW